MQKAAGYAFWAVLHQSRGFGQLGHQGAICRLNKELFMVHGTLNIFFRNKTFLFVKIES